MTSVNETTLSPDLTMDAVTLRVGDLDEMSSYYQQALALDPLEEQTHGREVHRTLGRGETPMVRLIHTPNLPTAPSGAAGLYHTAFLFDNARDLAATVYRTAQDSRSRFEGSSDHFVSEAFYFTDPEGNGIELYTDRPRDKWTYQDGQVRMGTVYLDPNAYLQKHLSEDLLLSPEKQPGTVGHVHLQVGNIAQAKDFYVDTLGFETTVDTYPGALFASAGGYHHHVAMNTWNSRGAGPRAASLGLATVAATVPAREDLDALVSRLTSRGVDFADNGDSVTVSDPWNTQVTLSLAPRS